MTYYVDMHCHLHELVEEYGVDILDNYSREYIIVAVSDDLSSSLKTLELREKYSFIKPCIGIHPWSIGETPENHLEEIERIVSEKDIVCLGEIGLDTRFVRETIDKQRMFFQKFLEIAREYNLVLNLHTAGTWREVLDLLIRYDIDKAFFHWYTGPKTLLEEIASYGYYIGANPAWKIQKKHREILGDISLDIVVTESDAPYKYRGLEMKPELVRDTIEFLAETHGVSKSYVIDRIYYNFSRLLR